MTSALLPNGIDYAILEEIPEGEATPIAMVTQPIPDQRHTSTLVEYWFTVSAVVDTDDLILLFECWSAAPGSLGYDMAAQIGGTLTVTVVSAAAMETPLVRHCKLAWIDQRPQQSGLYVITGAIDQGEIVEDSYVGQSVALTAVAP